MSSDLAFWRVVPRPCPHDLAGHPHQHLSEFLACLEANGNPGFDLVREG